MDIRKTLIITTGTEDWIIGELLPSLYNEGKYQGDVLILNYGEFERDSVIAIIEEYNKVFFKRTIKEYLRFTTDRFRGFTEVLRDLWQKYDIIMHVDGNDIEFKEDIGPLLNKVKDKILITQEPVRNSFVDYWETYHTLPKEFRDLISTEQILQTGVFLGPSELMYQVIKLVSELEEYDTRFGMDQLMLNVILYTEKCFEVIGREWDWFDSYGKNDNAKILHHAGKRQGKHDETDFIQPVYRFVLFPSKDEPNIIPSV